MSAQYDITASGLRAANYRPIHAGDDYSHRFTVERPPGSPLDLTNAKLWFTVKQGSKESDAQAKLFYDSDNVADIEITVPAAGQFTIHFQAVDTNTLEGTWVYDIKALLSTGSILRLAYGTIEFLPNITKAYV